MKFYKPKIILYLNGGLGNQMFQYAFGRCLAVKNKLPLWLNTGLFREDKIFRRQFQVDCFNIKPGRVINNTFRTCNKLLIASRLKKRIHEPRLFSNSDEYDKLISSGQPINSLEPKLLTTDIKQTYEAFGYWQSYKYFENYRNILLDDFKLLKSLSSTKKIEAEQIKNCNAICLGIRCYAETKEAEIHYKLSKDYYSKAIDNLSKKTNNPHFFIFTLDQKWAEDNLPFDKYPMTFIKASDNPCEDMYIMSLCKHFIISNSTFHWWGAWLSQYSDKIVIAPKLGWANTDPIPKKWITI